jgi:ERCC4-type nuclease
VQVVNTKSADFAHGGGDFVFTGAGPDGQDFTIGVELKNINDYISSALTTDRLPSEQIPSMLNAYAYNYLLLMGAFRASTTCAVEILETFPLPGGIVKHVWAGARTGYKETSRETRSVPFSRLVSSIHSTTFGNGVHLLTAADEFSACWTLYYLWRFWQKPWEDHTFNGTRLKRMGGARTSIKNASNVYIYLTKAVPGIGAGKASAIAARFTTMEKLMKATQKEIEAVPTIGATLAIRIKDSFVR